MEMKTGLPIASSSLIMTADRKGQRLTGIRSVAVIGAGISGILATKYLVQEGLEVTVFERNEQAGGIWLVDGPFMRLS